MLLNVKRVDIMDKISPIYDDYSDITKKYGEKIKQRFADLYSSYLDFIKTLGLNDRLIVNKSALMNAILDYFTDIKRLKEFHHVELANKYKIFSYEIYWLLKRNIIQVIDDNAHDIVYINEKFLLSYTLNFLEKNFAFDFSTNPNKKLKIKFDGFVQSYYYYLKYRDCNPQALEMIFLAIEAGYTMSNSNK